MNERIRELAYEAEDYADGIVDQGGEFHQAYTQKLAKLIVRECANLCNKIYFERYPDAEDFERSEESDAIKQHFGVE